MRLLLDSNVILWLAFDSPKLGAAARRRIRNADHVVVSVASLWELGIKAKAGKLPEFAALEAVLETWPAEVLPISRQHAHVAAQLPLLHRDPFDRMLVAQAIVETLVLVTADDMLPRYGVAALRA